MMKGYKLMKKCWHCNKVIANKGYPNKIGDFCSEEHFDQYYKDLSNEEIVQLMARMCVCSHDE